jgi:ketosteroid isomerase-like protein
MPDPSGLSDTAQTMSQENVEIVRRMFKAVWRRDYSDAESCFHADVEWHNTSVFPGPRTIVGPKAISAFWKELFETFEGGGEMEIEEVRADGECVVLGVHSWGHGKGSGVPVDVHWALTLSLHDGKIARVDVRGDYAKAVLAAGLEG